MSKKVITFYDSEKQSHDFPIITPDYGTCSTASNISAKVVICDDFSLFTGAEITVKFTNATTTDTITLNVNNSGAKNVDFSACGNKPYDEIKANGCYGFVYDGTSWIYKGSGKGASKEELERIKYYDDKDIIPSDESYFTVNSTGETITGLTNTGKTQTELVIPYEINGKKITTLFSGEESFVSILDGNSVITKVVIPNSVTSIGNYAFSSCSSLTSINIPNSVTSIENYAFSSCSSLTSINIPNSVTSIGSCTFSDCSSLTSINIPNSVTYIGSDAFSGCLSLTSIIIPNSVTSIVPYAFSACSSLKSINIPNSVTSIEFNAFQNCSSLTSVNIPNSVTSIGANAFESCTSLTSITIPNSVISIGDDAFHVYDDTSSSYVPIPGLTIYCEQGSYAETYAKKNNIPVKYTDVDLSNYIEKELGKGLSTNDYTDDDKTKLDTMSLTDLYGMNIVNINGGLSVSGPITLSDTNIDSRGLIFTDQGNKSINSWINEKADINNVLTKNNITEYTPTTDYNPATKKYVDDINTIASEETCILSDSLPLTVVSSDGWTGDLINGFTHINDNTNNLVLSLGEDTGNNIYQVTFNSSVDATDTNISVTIGDSEPFPLYGMPQPYSIGIKSISNGNVEFIPNSTFTGTITNITVKKIISTVQANKRFKVTDSRNSVVFEARFSNVDTINTSIPHHNVFLGLETGKTNTNGYGNVGLGSKALRNNTSGFWNTGIGFETLLNNTVGSRNVGIGYGALQKNICGTRNIAIGTFSMINNTTGGYNISIGADSMNDNISGNSNVSIGFQAMYRSISSKNNVAVGREALMSITTGSNNIALGRASGSGIKTGSNNMAVGSGSLSYCDNGSQNTAIGMNALYGLKNGNFNVAIGTSAGGGTSGTTFKENIFIGSTTGQKIGNNARRNIIIGYASGNTLTTGGYNIIIGATCEVPNEAGNYQLNIGNLITGNMATGSKSVTIDGVVEVDTPTADNHAATKKYVDDAINASSGEATNASTVTSCTGDELSAITSPAMGSIRYVSTVGTGNNTSITPGLYFYLGSWKKVALEDTAIISNEFVSGGDSTSINN